MIPIFTFNVIRLLFLSALAALISFLLAPFLIEFLNKIKFWKKSARTKTITNEEATVFYSLHKEKEVSTPRGGGLLIWLSVLIIIVLLGLLSLIPNPWWSKWIPQFNFISRSETWLPLFTLVATSIVGLIDDALTVYGKGKYVGGGISFKRRLAIVILIGLIGGWWFYFKLGWNTIHIPLIYNFPEGIDLFIGSCYIPLFALVMVACWAGGVVDGLDGLSGGIFASIFAAFSIIAFAQGKTDLATFCAIIGGTLFSFLWFNIPPAKFYMGETGILGLTSTMAVIAFLTDSVFLLPLIAGILVMEVGSIILQLLSKRCLHKKIWLCTPIHHHFEAKGWPPYKVTMRFWIMGFVLGILGVAIRLLG
jgi:phospho-N-acetylmuramoyl-pentapeptide-transferase